MAKTAKQVQTDIYEMLRHSVLASEVTGGVYRNGYRPRDSRAEDIVVTFTAGLPDEIETGVVTINVYVPDIDPYANGVYVEDGDRTESLEILAQEWVDSMTTAKSNYKFSLGQTIYTEEEQMIKQHFVVIKLKYELYEN